MQTADHADDPICPCPVMEVDPSLFTAEEQGIFIPFDDNPIYLENQWAEDTLVAFGREGYGEDWEHFQNLGSILCHFARWCDTNDLQLSEALKIAATLYKEETRGQGRQFCS